MDNNVLDDSIAALQRPALERQIGSLALSEVEGTGSLALLRAVTWYNVLTRLGIAVPLVVVHDVGCLIAGLGRPSASSQGMAGPELGEAWRQLLVELSDAEIVRSSGLWKHRDSMIGVVLARLFSSIVPQLPADAQAQRSQELSVEQFQHRRIDPRSAFARYDQEYAVAWMRTMCGHRLLPLLEIEQIDVDALRLFGLFRSESSGVAGLDLADIYSVIDNPALSDVIDFSLELLPSLLEVKREMGQQTFGIDGYAAIERIGNLDNLMLSQLAFDDETFEQKYANQELFYYTHEKQFENERRTHYVLVDGSASMRGVREVFARGLALALCKRLSVLGEHAVLRFFDSRIYEGVHVGSGTHAELPYVLQFRAERGRNYSAVIRQLTSELSQPRRKDGYVLVYLITHGECQIPEDEIQALASKIPIYGVFILPRGELRLEYTEYLHRVHVIDQQAIAHGRRATKAKQIIEQVETDLAAASTQAGRISGHRGHSRS